MKTSIVFPSFSVSRGADFAGLDPATMPHTVIEAQAALTNALHAMGLTLGDTYTFGRTFPPDFDAAHRLARAFPVRQSSTRPRGIK